MDQLKTAMAFVVKHRFWFSIGLVTILAIATYPSGARTLMMKANQRKQQLDGVFNDVSGYKSKVAPNTKWVEAADVKQKELSKVVDTEWEKIYLRQQELMTWPQQVSSTFAGRPFMADLGDNRNEFLITYKFAFPDQIIDIYYMLNPLSEEGGAVYGVVDSGIGVIQSAIWDQRTPTSAEAWLAQEELWIERAIIKAVAESNKGATAWKDAAVRRLVAIGIGNGGLDSKTASAAPTLISGLPDDAAAAPAPQMGGFATPGGNRRGFGASTGKRGNQNIDPIRYLEKNEQYRVIPVGVSMLVDQMKIPQILAALANADFYFTIRQVSAGVPDVKVEEPRLLREYGLVSGSSAGDNVALNTMQLDVWGVMRLYEMPPSLKEKLEAKPGEGTAPGEQPAPPAAPGDVTAKAATEAPPTGAPVPPAAEKAADAKSAEAKPADAKAPEAKPADPKAAEKPAEVKPAEPKADAKPAEAKPAEPPKAEAKPAEPKAEEKAAEAKPAEPKAEAKPAEKQ